LEGSAVAGVHGIDGSAGGDEGADDLVMSAPSGYVESG
jgi:hypothetical protein